MKDSLSRYGEWALIAGAAEGIGAAFSRRLAEAGMNLILVDINRASLDLLADELEQSCKIVTTRIIQDLSEENAAPVCTGQVKDVEVRLLVYVPALSIVGKFTGHTPGELDRLLSLNVRTPLHLVHSFLLGRPEGKPCGIILMSSLAGMIGPALAAPYAATRAFSVIFSESLFYELKKDKVDILACCAGPTSTPTYWKSKPAKQGGIIDIMQPADVVTHALKMLGKKAICVPGWKNRLMYYFLLRMIPRKIAGKLVSNSMFRMYPGR